MAMLKRMSIERFKSARRVELEFGRVNLFIGGNGAGKSNLLEAIGVLAAALNRGVTDAELARKGVRLTPPALMKSAFKHFELPKTLRLEAEFSGDVTYDLELSAGEKNTSLAFFSEKGFCGDDRIFGRSGAGARVLGEALKNRLDKHRSLWDQTRTAFEFSEKVQKVFGALSRFAIYAPQTEFLREIRSSSAVEPPIGLHGEGLALAVASLIKQIHHYGRARTKEKNSFEQIKDAFDLVWLPGWASTVKVDALDPLLRSREMTTSEGKTVFFIDRFMHQRRNFLSAYDSSEGTLFLLFIAVLLAHEEAPPIFALDNVDNALNPSLTRALIESMVRIAKRKQKYNLTLGPEQVFLTSHNPTALDAFDLFDSEQRVFVVARDGKGHTQVTRLAPKSGMTRDDWWKAFGGKKLSQLWIDGDIRGALGSSVDEAQI